MATSNWEARPQRVGFAFDGRCFRAAVSNLTQRRSARPQMCLTSDTHERGLLLNGLKRRAQQRMVVIVAPTRLPNCGQIDKPGRDTGIPRSKESSNASRSKIFSLLQFSGYPLPRVVTMVRQCADARCANCKTTRRG